MTGAAAARDPAPDLVSRLARARFSGYVRYSFAVSEGVLLFNGGKLLTAVLSRGGGRVTGLDALAGIFERITTEDGTVEAYRLSADLVLGLHGLLQGEYVTRGQVLRLVDIRALLAHLKEQKLNGCVRVYTPERTALILYKDGNGLGFFHDGCEELQTTATESQKIAQLPGAMLDVLSTRPAEQLSAYDLLEMVNLDKLWAATTAAHAAQHSALHGQAEEEEQKRLAAIAAACESALKDAARASLGTMGANLVVKGLAECGGAAALCRSEAFEKFLVAFDRGARLLAGSSKVKELVERMRAEITTRLDPQGTSAANGR